MVNLSHSKALACSLTNLNQKFEFRDLGQIRSGYLEFDYYFLSMEIFMMQQNRVE